MRPKTVASFRLSDEAKAMLQLLSDHLGISQAAVLETLIRERAKRERLLMPLALRASREATLAREAPGAGVAQRVTASAREGGGA